LQLRLDEALEHILLHEAADAVESERVAAWKRRSRRDRDAERLGIEDPQVEVRTGEEARALADTPHLTGDPEFDAIELAATAPDRNLG